MMDLGLMLVTISSVTTQGLSPRGLRSAPIATSHSESALANTLGIIVLLWTRDPRLFSNLRSFSRLLSKTFTLAPRPKAARIAYSPTAPAPNTTICVGWIPGMPQKSSPLPEL